MSAAQQRLLQALENFSTRTKGQALPKGAEEALAALRQALSQPAPGKDTPGQREALKVAPGTRGTGEDISRAAKGIDGPSPGQREAMSVSEQIQQAAEAIAAKH